MAFSEKFIEFIQRRTKLKYVSTQESALSILDSIDGLLTHLLDEKEILRGHKKILLKTIRERNMTIESAIDYIVDSLRLPDDNAPWEISWFRESVIRDLNYSFASIAPEWFNELTYLEILHISKKNLRKFIEEDFGVVIPQYRLKEIKTLTQLWELIASSSKSKRSSSSPSGATVASNPKIENRNKETVIREFDFISELHRKAIDSISATRVRHQTLSSIQKSFLNELKNVLLEIQTNINELRKEIVWDHLVVGFFGETNAGKSTTIETLRLKYGKGDRNWVHGAIVGDGQADFTKDASEYELDLNGKHVTLIDIPGIEGDESKYAAIIKKALRRAHYVFYVHCKKQQPDEKIASRIKEYLADWTQVYSIMNVSGRPGNYDEPEERETLLTSEVMNQNALIQDAFRKTLGDLYQSNIPLQALIALASCSDFPENKSLGSDAMKLKKYFGDTETAYHFSNMEALVKVLEHSSDTFEEIIANSQMQKLQAIKIKSRKKLADFEIRTNNQLDELTQRLESLCSDIKSEINSKKSELKRGLDSIVDSQFSGVLSSCYSIIDKNGDSGKVKSKAVAKIENLPYRLNATLNRTAEDIIYKLQTYLTKRFSEFKGMDIALPNTDFNMHISIDVDIDSAVKNLDISLEDVLDVGATVAGSAAAGAGIGSIFPVFGTIAGAAIGAGVGLIGGIGKKVAFGDGGKAKAKQAIKDEIFVCRNETKEHLKEVKADLCRELEKMGSRLVKQVQTEINNIDNLREERSHLYNILRK